MVLACLSRRVVMMLSCCDLGLPSMAVSISVLHLRATLRSAFSASGVIAISRRKKTASLGGFSIYLFQ